MARRRFKDIFLPESIDRLRQVGLEALEDRRRQERQALESLHAIEEVAGERRARFPVAREAVYEKVEELLGFVPSGEGEPERAFRAWFDEQTESDFEREERIESLTGEALDDYLNALSEEYDMDVSDVYDLWFGYEPGSHGR